jgi:hypothetical protein
LITSCNYYKKIKYLLFSDLGATPVNRPSISCMNRSTLFLFHLTGYIDLSKRRVSPEEVCKCEEKFAKAKAVSILFNLKIKVHHIK